MKAKSRRSGFTLLELVIVLGILALLTHIAMRETARTIDDVRVRLAAKQLDEVQAAVCGTRFERDADGATVRTGFVADMGRLPVATLDDATGRLTLSELWARPAECGEYAVRQAVAANLAPGHTAADIDADVYVPCGWRGPYVSFANAESRLRDAWGNPCEVPDDAGFRTRRLAADGAEPAEGTPVTGIAHYGADGRPDSGTGVDSPRNKDDSREFADGRPTTLTVVLEWVDADGTPQPPQAATLRVYSPSNGLIAVSRATTTTSTAVLEGLTPGPRVLRVEAGGAKVGSPRVVQIQPGGTLVTQRIVVH